MKLTLGYSPCPNDCFIFDALLHKKIDTEGLDFEVQHEDVETLNRMALKGELDITKLSFHAYAYVAKEYILLRAGSALGFNCGPLLVEDGRWKMEDVKNLKVAIPGKMTTANFLLSLAYPQLTNKVEYVFSEIEDAVLNGEVDAGLIIHENRFTYEQKGLKKVMDLGEFWHSLIHAPIPLGGIVIKRNLDSEIQQKVNRVIRKSVEFAFENPESSMPYVREHAQAMSEEVMKNHIALYVNDFSIDLGETGINAVNLMFGKGKELDLFDVGNNDLIIS
ncbi:1,4-dihydroxy-6-naphthoate synthase [Aurantibacillus circumpalustris]|uniref:1,4-dihydroxy-6-naphthoate synthase n=1 Tax=Aurantibacillus circumpalustris TaxID=3036359 RepID=UPI00295B57E1|nr:1,4-dihydroxy-6-naphthoate synthase [Aurantibacillus circumpalustris]